jgi:hypothetical protein
MQVLLCYPVQLFVHQLFISYLLNDICLLLIGYGNSRLNCQKIVIIEVLWDHTDVIWRQRTPFEAMTGRRALIGLLAEVFLGFPQS